MTAGMFLLNGSLRSCPIKQRFGTNVPTSITHKGSRCFAARETAWLVLANTKRLVRVGFTNVAGAPADWSTEHGCHQTPFAFLEVSFLCRAQQMPVLVQSLHFLVSPHGFVADPPPTLANLFESAHACRTVDADPCTAPGRTPASHPLFDL